MKFTPDDNIQKVAKAYSLDACDFFHKHFQITLDWTDESIEHVEMVMDVFHKQVADASPSEDQVMSFAKMFGSYIGEVYRKNHGARWGTVEMDSARFPGLQASLSDTTFWPWGRAKSRLVEGASNNVWHYYRELISDPKSK